LAATVIDDSIVATAHGDGSIILRRKADKAFVVHTISYKENYPYYPSYLTSDKRNSTWQAQTGNTKTIDTMIISNGNVSNAITESQSPFELFVYDANEYDIVLLSSDGIETFV
ncbi:PP2C family serine/threonine-protein phosphatase, partial [Streptomyces galilaeus]|uniref:hypothetical protein n=1 Tax=Streptomyces galilaeus TaxID=33899 RepID=UPI0038F6FFB9